VEKRGVKTPMEIQKQAPVDLDEKPPKMFGVALHRRWGRRGSGSSMSWAG
jgi:hypothetical protein